MATLLTAENRDALAGIIRQALAPGLGALSTFIDRQLGVGELNVRELSITELKAAFPGSCLKIESVNGLTAGEWYQFMFRQESVNRLLTVLLGEAGGSQRTEFSDMEMSIMEESLGQLAEPFGQHLAPLMGGTASFSAPRLDMLPRGIMTSDFSARVGEEQVVTVDADLAAGDDFGLGMTVVLPMTIIRNIIPINTGADAMEENKQGMQGDPLGDLEVQPVDFPSVGDEDAASVVGDKSNIDLIKDVSLEISVELGRTKLAIKDVLELSTGSVVILDKAAGGSVDLLVNNKLYARGEVVVIDENFGVRVTDILTPEERISGIEQ